MPAATAIKPTHKAVKSYYAALVAYARQDVEHESALRSAFQNLLDEVGRHFGWTLIPELSETAGEKTVRPDGTFRDDYYITRGHWEAKDSKDNLESEIKRKIAKGYPLGNTIFEDTRQGYLYQNGQLAMKADITKPQALADLLNAFFAYTEPAHENFGKAIGEFQQRVPDLARGLVEKINDAHKNNPRFIEAFGRFYELCCNSLNPNLRVEAVDEMLVQHLLTERLIRTIFDNQDFTRRNVIAAEVEKVIDALVSKSFDRHQFLKSLDRFYVAIESAAATIESFTEKQHFLNTVYERFFQGYSVKAADTHGIVYTPQEIVDFMCASVAEVLATEFGKTLGDPDVHILDPCTGTGNFIVNLLRRIPKKDLPRMYRRQLFANEVMLLPYYVAALNIEHAYYEQTGSYEPFEGLCFVDTLDLTKGEQSTFGFMTEENVVRVQRERDAQITVVIGNPPYNVGQVNENDNNKNRKYVVAESRIHDTYATDSTASNKNALSDAYVKFFRWATDRLNGRNGIVAMVSNNGFVTGVAFDGFRKHMLKDFDRVYHFDLKGNARTTAERRQREGGNVFSDQIRVGIGITILVRAKASRPRRILYHVVPDRLTAPQKKLYLAKRGSISGVRWLRITPDAAGMWLTSRTGVDFVGFIPISSKGAKAARAGARNAIFSMFSVGAKTNRDDVCYDFDRDGLSSRIQAFVDDYNAEVDRYNRRQKPTTNVDDFVRCDKIKWSASLKANLMRARAASFSDNAIRLSRYRPFTDKWLYFDDMLVERRYKIPRILPNSATERENILICCTDHLQTPFAVQAVSCIPNEAVGGRQGQCFPFYVYDEDGGNRRENITDWALKHFREHYGNKRISKWDIFYYVYGILHHPGYRDRFAENLKRELPRIPLAPDFRAFATAGQKLARLHLDYEEIDPWKLEWIESPDLPLSYCVDDKMRLSKDKSALKINDSLTLADIPPEVFRYRLGNRSALEWIVDQYQVGEDKRSCIRSDPNRPDDPEYIVRLVGQVIRVSAETMTIIDALPDDFGQRRSR
jgi:predicted helicase